jgi:hypothetical protein
MAHTLRTEAREEEHVGYPHMSQGALEAQSRVRSNETMITTGVDATLCPSMFPTGKPPTIGRWICSLSTLPLPSLP